MTLHTGGLKVLAVDDNRTNLHVIQAFLKKLNHEVILAENGDQALVRFFEDKPDLVLLDIMMPGMNGFEVARRIKAHDQECWTPIIFLSALSRDENLLEGLEAGAEDYLTKPVNFVVLEAKLRSMQRALDLQRSSANALRKLQVVSDNIIDALITILPDGEMISVNRAAEVIFGWRQEEMLGRNVRMLMPEPFHSEHDHYLARYMGGGAPTIVGHAREVVGVRKSGEQFPVNLGVTEVSIDGQRRFVGLLRDISATRAAEQKLKDNARQLQAYFEQTQAEQGLALNLVEMQLRRRGLEDARLRYKVIPAENFSGDIVAAERSAEGGFYALLADATGHGLTAAMSVLPVLALFYRLARRNHPIRELVLELNQQLKESMPIGRFVAASLVRIDTARLTGELWVGGTPPPLLLSPDGSVQQEFPSNNLPLGIVAIHHTNCAPVEFAWAPGSQLLICSDGLIEASNAAGEQFGLDDLRQAACSVPPGERFVHIEQALANHLGAVSAADDISLMIIDCP